MVPVEPTQLLIHDYKNVLMATIWTKMIYFKHVCTKGFGRFKFLVQDDTIFVVAPVHGVLLIVLVFLTSIAVMIILFL